MEILDELKKIVDPNNECCCKYCLSNKCKEWAHKKGFSYIGNNGLINIHSSDNKIIAIINNNIENWFDIEIDIIACNWILENSKNDSKAI